MTFGLFFLGEYGNMILMSSMTTILFLGDIHTSFFHTSLHLFVNLCLGGTLLKVVDLRFRHLARQLAKSSGEVGFLIESRFFGGDFFLLESSFLGDPEN